MPQLEIRFSDGRQSLQPLDRKTPITVGAQTFNDICVAEPDVGVLHCRIGWNKTGFEVTAATARGVELNGSYVEHAFLNPGDVLRVGSCDLKYLPDPGEAVPSRATDANTNQAAGDRSKKEKGGGIRSPDLPKKGNEKDRRKDKPALKEPDVNDLSLFDGPVFAESVEDLTPYQPEKEQEFPGKSDKPAMPVTPGSLLGERRRPGEQEIFKSPLILGLSGGAALLLLIAGTLWFLMGREISSKLFAQAEQNLNEAKYAQAIEQFEQYAMLYPSSERALPAKINAAKARVRKELSGASPAWSLAWDRLQEMVKEFRSTPVYKDLLPSLRNDAEEIALGAAQAAEQMRDETLLPISAEATLLLERSADPDVSLEPVLARIRLATSQAEVAITRQKARDATLAQMKEALEKKKPIEALGQREKLLRAYPDYRRDKGIESALQQALEMERNTVTVTEADQPALPVAEEKSWHSVLPFFHARSRTTDSSLGQSVWILSQESCYAVDTMTGEPLWRRIIGSNPPFSPVEIRGESTDWLLYDRARGELVRCRANDGQLLWKQSLAAVPEGIPLVDEGQIYLSLKNAELWRMDADTGRVSAKLGFSQPLAGGPILDATRQVLFVTGQRGLIYSLRKRPLECAAVTFTDHAAGSVRAPLLSLGRLLLLCENDRTQSARLRLWNASPPDKSLPLELEKRVEGLVFDAPVLRGSQLVIPLQGERVAAFIVNDEAGRAEMNQVGLYRVQDGYGGPLHVMLGPDQQFWLSSTGFRRFEIAADSLRMDQTVAAVGLTAQPLQAAGETVFVGRRSSVAEGVQLSNIDRNSMTASWRTLAGARPVLFHRTDNGVTLVTQAGVIFNLGSSRLTAGGMDRTSGVDLEWPADLQMPPLFGQLPDGRMTAAIAGKTPRLYVIDPTGRSDPPIELSAPLQQPPIALATGLILPSANRLDVRPNDGTRKYEPWRAPVVEGEAPRWAGLWRTADDEFLALDSQHRCRRLQIREGETPHVAEVAATNLPAELVIPAIVWNGHLVTGDAGHTVRLLDPRTLEAVATWQGTEPLGGCTIVDDHLLVWDAAQAYLLRKGDLSVVWSSSLEKRRLVGRALVHQEAYWIAVDDGRSVFFNQKTGQLTDGPAIPQSTSLGLQPIGEAVWNIACDSTLYRLSGETTP